MLDWNRTDSRARAWWSVVKNLVGQVVFTSSLQELCSCLVKNQTSEVEHFNCENEGD